MITVAALVLFTVLCIALSDDLAWDNVTRSTRNALVFQDRHQGYGAYQLRRDYDRRFVIAFLSALGILAAGLGALTLLPRDAMGVSLIPAGEKIVEVVIPPAGPDPVQKTREDTHVKVHPPTPPTPPQRTGGAVEASDSLTHDRPPVDTTSAAPVPPVTGGDPGKGPAGKGPGTGPFVPEPKPIIEPNMAEILPQFPGGEAAMFRWVQQNVEFPNAGLDKDKVYVQFVVNEDGSLSDIKAVRGMHPAFMREAERVVRKMPKWKAARAHGEDVPCRLVLPISFETK